MEAISLHARLWIRQHAVRATPELVLMDELLAVFGGVNVAFSTRSSAYVKVVLCHRFGSMGPWVWPLPCLFRVWEALKVRALTLRWYLTGKDSRLRVHTKGVPGTWM